MFRIFLSVFAVLVAVSSAASAQDGANLDQLREQLRLLQEQIETASQAPAKRTNVTQIAGPRARIRDGGLVIRIYDLGDLFAVAPPYAAAIEGDLSDSQRDIFSGQGRSYSGSGGGGFGGGVFSLQPKKLQPPGADQHVANQFAGNGDSVRTSQDALIETIKKTISPDVWDEAGGEATIAKLGNAFIISADETTHSQIDALLNLFRERWGTLRTISVRAWWLWMSPAEVVELLDSDGEPVKPDDAPAFGLVPNDTWQQILGQWAEGGEDRPRGYQATLTCYNGQTVHTLSGDQTLAVTGIRPRIARNENDEAVGRIAYKPVLSVIHEGLAFQITPNANVSGKTVLLDLHSRVSTPMHEAKVMEKVEQAGVEPSPQDVVDVIDQRRLNIHRLSTTIRIPVNRPMLVGGMSAAAHPGAGDGHNLYLFVKASVQELRNDNEEEEEVEPAPEPAPLPPGE